MPDRWTVSWEQIFWISTKLALLLMMPNVIVTSHQAFFTKEATHNIAVTTLQNIRDFEDGKELVNEVK